MTSVRLLITIVCIIATFIANAGQQLTAKKSKGAANQPTAAELQLLQGTWQGVMVGHESTGKITITITGNSFHFYRDTNFWFETTITLPAGKAPKQLHATIKDCAEQGSIGEVVKAFYKIEDGTLTLATTGGDAEETPEIFETAENRYELRKVKPQKKNIEPPKTGAPSDLLDLNGLSQSSQNSHDEDGDIARSPGKISGYSAWKTLILEGRELHPSLKTRLVDEPILHMRSGMLLPRNPYTSTGATFVEAVSGSTSMGKNRTREGIRSALYASYADEKKLVLLRGLEAASALDADRREAALRKTWAYNARGGRAQVHRKGLLLVVAWHDGLSPEVWAAVNASVAKRMVAPDKSPARRNKMINNK